MARRASLPGASELFRPTDGGTTPPPAPEPPTRSAPPTREAPAPSPGAETLPAPTGRVRHDHKITVYFSEEELLALEDANLTLRRSHAIRVDRGRLVRTAVAVALRDFHSHGEESMIISELRE